MTTILESIPFLTPAIWFYSQTSCVIAIVLEDGNVFPFVSIGYKGVMWLKQLVAVEIEHYW